MPGRVGQSQPYRCFSPVSMGSMPTQAPSQIATETLPVAHTLKVQQNWKNFSEKSVSICGETVHASHN